MSARHNFHAKAMPGPELSAPSVQPFPELNLDKIKGDLNLGKEGEKRGEKNLPASNSEIFDDVEHRITGLIENEYNRQQQSFEAQLNACQQCIASLDLENEAVNISAAAQRASSEFAVKVEEGKAALFTLWRNACLVENQWNDFRKTHGLLYPADYPLSRLWNFAIIIVILAVESVLNGSFLARGLETGYIGGIVQAFAIASVNVVFGFFLGDVIVRHLFHHHKGLRLLACLELSVSGGIAVFFNLLVGHYRDALGGGDPMHASQTALSTFTAHPFVLGEFQSWILFAMGLFFWLVATLDGFKMDDPYPGYGKITRKHEEIIGDYTNEKANIIDALSHTRDKAIEYMQGARQGLAERRATLSSALDARERLIRLFETHRNYLNRATNDLLSVYRNANMQVRTTPAPAHFNIPYALAIAAAPTALPTNVNQTQLDLHIEATNGALKQAINQVNAGFEQAAGEFRKIGEFTSEAAHVV